VDSHILNDHMKQDIIGQIVAPPFACGLPWLVNVLLELDIQMTNGEFEAGHWSEDGGTYHLSDEAAQTLQPILPVLNRKQSFQFEPGQQILWGSRLDWARHIERRTVLLIRDPRDALYAFYEAQGQAGISYEEYLLKQQVWSATSPDLLKLSPADAYGYFSLFWMAMADVMKVTIVRYEDICKNREAVVSHVVSFLGFERTQAQIAKATAAAAEFQRNALTPDKVSRDFWFSPNVVNAMGGWKREYSRSHLDYMDGPANYFMHLQGYEVDSAYDYADVVVKMPRVLLEMPDVLHGLLRKIRRLDQYGDADMVRRSIIGAAGLFAATSLERAWTALFFQAYEWVESILPLAQGHAAQRQAAFDQFCLLNRYFLGTPTINNAVQDIFAQLDVKVSIEPIRLTSGLAVAPAP